MVTLAQRINLGSAVMAFLLCLPYPQLTSAQGPQSGRRVPPPGDPDVYLSFFSYQDSCARRFARLDPRNTKATGRFLAAVLKDVRITPAEFNALTAISRSTLSEVRNVNRQTGQYLAARKRQKQPFDMAVLRTFDRNRTAAITSGWEKTHAALSPAAWSSIQQFVDQTYRLRTVKYGIGSGW
ncbi:MAG: hypothetical protein IT165_31460 [Bryobacterales bacterium]|nr:hypothetical protein [Bryobacterales bacterium]